MNSEISIDMLQNSIIIFYVLKLLPLNNPPLIKTKKNPSKSKNISLSEIDIYMFAIASPKPTSTTLLKTTDTILS